MQWEAGHICILTKREKNKPLVWSGHTAFNSSQLQPCCRVLVMAILEYKLFTCSNTQTTAGIQVFFLHLFPFFTALLCVYVCVFVWFYAAMSGQESIWMKNKTLVACLINVNMCNRLYFFIQQCLSLGTSFQVYSTVGN